MLSDSENIDPMQAVNKKLGKFQSMKIEESKGSEANNLIFKKAKDDSLIFPEEREE